MVSRAICRSRATARPCCCTRSVTGSSTSSVARNATVRQPARASASAALAPATWASTRPKSNSRHLRAPLPTAWFTARVNRRLASRRFMPRSPETVTLENYSVITCAVRALVAARRCWAARAAGRRRKKSAGCRRARGQAAAEWAILVICYRQVRGRAPISLSSRFSWTSRHGFNGGIVARTPCSAARVWRSFCSGARPGPPVCAKAPPERHGWLPAAPQPQGEPGMREPRCRRRPFRR